MNRRMTVYAAALAIGAAVIGGFAGHAMAGHTIPACQTEDSPSCVWTDPESGIEYVNGYDAGFSLEDRIGMPWCVTVVQVDCLDVIRTGDR